ncbi:MAG: disulfide bond formation protein B [Pigmentiphaga sp.]|uniref:disulfide bond formation protein B n=1 Tax=Pigmentiphaga sp. TaxID=1977564 RepID=UPI0029B7490B|nr:disulfide bond formation protein B [Pigmentiphaga sp.]MDX3907942.1 disulfide bond formation protein B [Pigmentiphaga sp.]
MPAYRAALLNALALLGISGLLGVAFLDQIVFSELPCPLCLLQRLAFVLAGFGFALNILLGPRPSHYALVILSSLAGAAVAGRQTLLHIVPGSGAYGSPLFGLHFYTWAFIAFAAIVAGTAIVLMLDRQFEPSDFRGQASTPARRFMLAVVVLFGLLVAANALSTLLECSVGICPADPTGYELLS